MRAGSRWRLRALPCVGSRRVPWQPHGSAAGRPPLAPGTGTPGGHTPPSPGPRCRGRVTRGGGGAALAPAAPSPPLSTCCSRASRVAAGSPSTEGRKTPNTGVRLAPNSLRARHLSRSSPASRPKVTINPPRAEGHLTCQSPILARIDILAAGSESPGPCWSWTARASHSPWTPVGKSSPYLSRDSHLAIKSWVLPARACALPPRCLRAAPRHRAPTALPPRPPDPAAPGAPGTVPPGRLLSVPRASCSRRTPARFATVSRPGVPPAG